MSQAIITIDDDLVNLIREKMNTEDENLFVDSFKTYLKYGYDDSSFVINLDDIWKWVGFTRKDNAKALLIKNFIENINYKILLLQPQEQDLHGGHNKEMIMLTINTFKKFCMKAATKRADQICDYYIKMENITFNYIQNKITESNDIQLQQQKHSILLDKLDKKRTLYITRVCIIDNEKFVIKLGWSNGIQERNRAHRNHFGSSLLLEVFECDQNAEFELSLKQNLYIKNLAYTDENIKSTETYLVNNDQYDNIIKFIKKNIGFYQGFNAEQYLELERIKVQNKLLELIDDNNKDNIINILLNLSKNKKLNEETEEDIKEIAIKEDTKEISIKKEDTEEIKEDTKKIAKIKVALKKNTNNKEYNEITNEIADIINDDTKEEIPDDNEFEKTNLPRKNTRQRKVQQYDPKTLKLIKTFDGVMETIRTFKQMSFVGLKDAILKNTEYYNYRWYFIANDAEHKEYEIPPTVKSISSVSQYVALLNFYKNRIENVYISQAEAARQLNIKRKQSVNDSINIGTFVKKQYFFKFFYECDKSMQDDYLNRNEGKLPEPTNIGINIEQINIKTKQVIKTFNSIADVLKEFCISRASLKEHCTSGEPYKGFIWQIK
jgi:hypothetical protein